MNLFRKNESILCAPSLPLTLLASTHLHFLSLTLVFTFSANVYEINNTLFTPSFLRFPFTNKCQLCIIAHISNDYVMSKWKQHIIAIHNRCTARTIFLPLIYLKYKTKRHNTNANECSTNYFQMTHLAY